MERTHEQDNQGKRLSTATGEATAAAAASATTAAASTAGPKTEVNEKATDPPLFEQGEDP